MPTLQFKGKNIIWNHHLSVPYHTLEEVPELHYQPEQGEGNLIIEGDNLLALKALLPQYAGKVKCVYIDPPYNTGNEGWIYNDKANSPLINEWIGKTIAKDDLSKHDKWLCMMTPRLKILKELLKEDGILFVSIGEDELANLLNLLNEIFGEEKLVCIFSWKSRSKPTNAGNAKFRPQKVSEYVIAYTNGDVDEMIFNLSSGSERTYPNSDDDGDYRLTTILTSNLGVYKRETMRFELNGFTPNEEQRWKAGEDEIFALFNSGRIVFNNDGVPVWKKYKNDEDELLSPMYTFMDSDLTGTAENGKAEVNKLIGKGHGFDTIKPVNLIKYLIEISTEQNDIILDSFAGTGTTMQAIFELNQSGSNRKGILVQMPENTESEPDINICLNITKLRVEKSISFYNFNTGFKYMKVGASIDPDTMLDGNLPNYQQFAEYVYYLATGSHLETKADINPTTHFVGNAGGKAIFLIYEQDIQRLSSMALTLHLAENIIKDSPGKRRLIYAPACFLDEEYMSAMQIEFVSIPYNLFEKRQ